MRHRRNDLIVLGLTLLFYACGERGSGLGSLPRGLNAADLNLVLVTLDTTRADRIGCYGAKDVATPHLDGLAAGGARFDAAVSPMPLTLPAHCTLFTGLLPGAHGVRDNGGFKLAAEHVTLAEVLKERGLATGLPPLATDPDQVHASILRSWPRFFKSIDSGLAPYTRRPFGGLRQADLAPTGHSDSPCRLTAAPRC